MDNRIIMIKIIYKTPKIKRYNNKIHKNKNSYNNSNRIQI